MIKVSARVSSRYYVGWGTNSKLYFKLNRKREIMETYIHYGCDHFDKTLFNPIENCKDPWVKPAPYAGMWGSPINSINGWKNWCEDNDFDQYRLNKSFIFTLKEDSNILHVRDNNELQDLKLLHCFDRRKPRCRDDLYCMDFEKLRDAFEYDAMEVHITTNEIYFGLYGWDCDSILILNPDCIIELDNERVSDSVKHDGNHR